MRAAAPNGLSGACGTEQAERSLRLPALDFPAGSSAAPNHFLPLPRPLARKRFCLPLTLLINLFVCFPFVFTDSAGSPIRMPLKNQKEKPRRRGFSRIPGVGSGEC